MKDKINVAELLKDCPSGMKLDCTMYDDVFFYEITDDLIFPIHIKRIDGAPITLTKYGGYADCPTSKCVIFPKGKNTWEGFHKPFKDGDIVFYDNCVSIFKEWGDETLFRNYVKVDIDSRHVLCDKTISNGKSIKRESRFATEEEKQKLFQAIKDNGYKWNEETKTLEKLDEPKFKNGDVITCTNSACSFVAIFKESNTDITFRRYVSLTLDPVQQFWTNEGWCDFSNPRLATEEEKQKLFQAIKDNGYKWNPETKTLEKLSKFKVGDRITLKNCNDGKPIYKITKVKNDCYETNQGELPFYYADSWKLVPNKFDITTLKPFDKVLVRDFDNGIWDIEFFSRLLDGKHFKCLDVSYTQCIPYEGNEHLLGKTDDCDEFYRTWEKTGD